MTSAVDTARTVVADQGRDWLARFGQALSSGDIGAVAEMFAPECYWRNLVAFTWNITTVEGRAEVTDMLRATLEQVSPSGFRATQDPTETDGVIEVWFEFDTAVGRGSGILRVVGGAV